MKEARHKEYILVWCHLNKILEQSKLNEYDREISVCLELGASSLGVGDINSEMVQWELLSDGNILCFDYGGSYTVLYIHQNHWTTHLQVVHYRLCKL